MNAVLIDGDHNWYTAFHELRLIEKVAEESGAGFPVVFLHDVDWPYGRRDLYYDPDTIPEQYRHAFKKAGLRAGRPELSREGGLNANLANAVSENTERNGVRTAVEDFISEGTGEFRFVVVPGWHGLGILASTALADANEALAQLLTGFESDGFLLEQCRRIERSRIRTTIREKEKRKGARREVRTLQEQLASKERELAESRAQLEAMRSSNPR